MPEDPKVMPVVCKGCSSTFEVKVPEYFVRVVKERCECGLDESARIARAFVTGASVLFLCLFGSCAVHNHYNYQAVKAVADQYNVRKVKPGEGIFMESPELQPIKKEDLKQMQEAEKK